MCWTWSGGLSCAGTTSFAESRSRSRCAAGVWRATRFVLCCARRRRGVSRVKLLGQILRLGVRFRWCFGGLRELPALADRLQQPAPPGERAAHGRLRGVEAVHSQQGVDLAVPPPGGPLQRELRRGLLDPITGPPCPSGREALPGLAGVAVAGGQSSLYNTSHVGRPTRPVAPFGTRCRSARPRRRHTEDRHTGHPVRQAKSPALPSRRRSSAFVYVLLPLNLALGNANSGWPGVAGVEVVAVGTWSA